MRKNKSAREERMASIAQAIGADEAADKAIQMVEALPLQDRIGIAKSIAELAERCRFQANENDIDELIEHAS